MCASKKCDLEQHDVFSSRLTKHVWTALLEFESPLRTQRLNKGMERLQELVQEVRAFYPPKGGEEPEAGGDAGPASCLPLGLPYKQQIKMQEDLLMNRFVVIYNQISNLVLIGEELLKGLDEVVGDAAWLDAKIDESRGTFQGQDFAFIDEFNKVSYGARPALININFLRFFNEKMQKSSVDGADLVLRAVGVLGTNPDAFRQVLNVGFEVVKHKGREVVRRWDMAYLRTYARLMAVHGKITVARLRAVVSFFDFLQIFCCFSLVAGGSCNSCTRLCTRTAAWSSCSPR